MCSQIRSARTVIRTTVAGSMPRAMRSKLSWVTGVYLHLVAAECLSAMFISILRLLRYRHFYGLDIQYKQMSEWEKHHYPLVKMQLKWKESALLVAQLNSVLCPLSVDRTDWLLGSSRGKHFINELNELHKFSICQGTKCWEFNFQV